MNGTDQIKLEPVRNRDRRSRSAFSLIELILCIAILALLLGILIPVLGHARHAFDRHRCLSNLRTHATAFSAYLNDWDDTWPIFIRPDGSHDVDTFRRDAVPYSWHISLWKNVLAPRYYDGNHTNEVFFAPDHHLIYPDSPFLASYRHGASSYRYSVTFVSRPEFWHPETRTDDLSQLRPTRASEVRFPSAKGLVSVFNSSEPAYVQFGPNDQLVWHAPGRMRYRIATVDGAAKAYPMHRVLIGYRGTYPDIINSTRAKFSLPTLHGVRGMDIVPP